MFRLAAVSPLNQLKTKSDCESKEVRIGAGDSLAGFQILSLEVHPSVARMNLALALAVAGLAFSAARVFVASPGGQAIR